MVTTIVMPTERNDGRDPAWASGTRLAMAKEFSIDCFC
jgi:hypothetical protein